MDQSQEKGDFHQTAGGLYAVSDHDQHLFGVHSFDPTFVRPRFGIELPDLSAAYSVPVGVHLDYLPSGRDSAAHLLF